MRPMPIQPSDCRAIFDPLKNFRLVVLTRNEGDQAIHLFRPVEIAWRNPVIGPRFARTIGSDRRNPQRLLTKAVSCFRQRARDHLTIAAISKKKEMIFAWKASARSGINQTSV